MSLASYRCSTPLNCTRGDNPRGVPPPRPTRRGGDGRYLKMPGAVGLPLRWTRPAVIFPAVIGPVATV